MDQSKIDADVAATYRQLLANAQDQAIVAQVQLQHALGEAEALKQRIRELEDAEAARQEPTEEAPAPAPSKTRRQQKPERPEATADAAE